MPIYEYVCTDCNTRFERMRPLSRSTEPAPCPTCEKDSERVLSRFACVTTDDSGVSAPVGGSACSACSASSCSSCGV